MGNYEQLGFVWRTKIQFLLTHEAATLPLALSIFHMSLRAIRYRAIQSQLPEMAIAIESR
jgi:hypothetical protein